MGAALDGGDERIVFLEVTIVDPRLGELLPSRSVVIRGNRIEAVGASAELQVPSNARAIDGDGRYLIPGLWDMHVHMTNMPPFGELFIANGVTGVRDMFTMGSVDALKDTFLSGRMVGPRVVAGGRIVDGEDPLWPFSIEARNPEEGRAAVQKVRGDGADFVKVYSKLGRDTYLAIAAEAAAQGMPFAGHIPFSVTAAEASAAGQRSVEHLTGVYAGCSSREADLVGPHARGYSFTERGRIARESYDPEVAQELFALFADNETWQCPTLVVLRSIANLDDPEFVADERLTYLPDLWAQQWNPENDRRFRDYTAADWEDQRGAFAQGLFLIGEMHAAGVPILAGTDCANPYVFPGFSLHDELELLVKAGLTDAEALRAATWSPAEYFERTDELGTVEAGKLADLVLLDANPLEDVANTRRVAAVVANGRLFDASDLAALLER